MDTKTNPFSVNTFGLIWTSFLSPVCHPPPFYLDHQHHDLQVERFLNEPPRGQIKTFSLRGIRESPPYLHDGRLLTLKDTVEFFNLVFELRLTADEKRDLVAFMRCL